MSFKGKVVIVTGASSGIGAATAISFAREGAKVVMVGRNQTKLNKVVEECTKVGSKPLVITADVSKDDEAKSVIDKTIEEYGQIDVLVNNAGMSAFGSILDGKMLSAYDTTLATNLRAPIYLTTLAAPHLIKVKGNIVNVSSTGAKHVPKIPGLTAYCISKSALEHFTRCAALELAPSGVRVNVVRPGPVKTDILENNGFPGTWDMFKALTPLNNVGEPEEIADLILYLASDKAKSITGTAFTSDNGYLLKN